MYRRLAWPLRCASVLGAACLLLVLVAPAWGATGAWDRAWGKDVVGGNAETGFEVCTVAALCQAAELRQDGPPVGGELYRPSDVAVAPNGDVYVAGAYPFRSIMVFDASGTFLRIFAAVSDPTSVAIDGAGNVYVAEDGPARILKYDSTGNFLRTWGKNVDSADPGTGAEICTVEANCQSGEQGGRGGEFGADPVVAVSQSGMVYVAERLRDRVQQFDSSGHFIRAWGNDVVEGNAETGPEQCTDASQCQFGGHGPTGGEFTDLWGIATDAAGNVYTAEEGADGGGGNARIQKFSPTGAFVFALGKNVDGSKPGTGFELCTNAPACLGGTAATTAGAFRSLHDVAVDRDGNLYASEADNHRVQKFAPSGAFLSTWGKGVSGGTGLETCTTVDGCRGGEIGGKGGEISFDLFGIGANAVNGRVVYTAETADGGRVQVFGTRTPTLTATSPASGGDDNQPKVIGDAQPGATVKLYGTPTCTGSVLATGDGATLASPGLPVIVGDNTTTTFYATATIGSETSPCSSPGLTYVEDSSGGAGGDIDTLIVAGPDGPVATATPAFGFEASPSTGATFECSVDSGAFAACSSPFTTPSLPDGRHSFQVRAVAPAGPVDATPATRVFFVDTVAPRAGIAIEPRTDIGGRQVSGGVFTGYVGIRVTTDDPEPSGGAGPVACAVDPPRAPATADEVRAGPCSLAVNTAGDHVVYGVAIDAAGNASSIVSATFRILPEPDTTITGGPTGVTWTTTPTFAFTANIPGSTFRCSVDAGPYGPCSSPFTTPALNGVGGHFIQVAAVSPSGAVDTTPARRDFQIKSVETHTYSCVIRPYQADPRRHGHNGCTFEPAGTTCSGFFAKCDSVVPPCPVGARCTYKVATSFADADINVNYAAWAAAEPKLGPLSLGESVDTNNAFTMAGCETEDETGNCSASKSVEIVGDGRAPYFACSTVGVAPTGLTQKYGPDDSRVMTCDFTISIQAAATLATTTSADTVTTFAPGAGTVTAAPAGASARAVAAALKSKKKPKPDPLFKPAKKTVKAAGPVTFKLALSKSARTTFKKKKGLKITIKLTFKPKTGRTRSKTITVTLRPKPVIKRPKNTIKK